MSDRKMFRLFFAWQDEAEERWLEGMRAKGFELIDVSFPGIYRFREAEARKVSYRLDYFPDKDRDEEYRAIFGDAGWRSVCAYNGWQYFTHPEAGREIYTDCPSKAAKYRRVLRLLTAVLPSQIMGLLVVSRAVRDGDIRPGLSVALAVLFVLVVASFIMVAVSFFKIWRRASELEAGRPTGA